MVGPKAGTAAPPADKGVARLRGQIAAAAAEAAAGAADPFR